MPASAYAAAAAAVSADTSIVAEAARRAPRAVSCVAAPSPADAYAGALAAGSCWADEQKKAPRGEAPAATGRLARCGCATGGAPSASMPAPFGWLVAAEASVGLRANGLRALERALPNQRSGDEWRADAGRERDDDGGGAPVSARADP